KKLRTKSQNTKKNEINKKIEVLFGMEAEMLTNETTIETNCDDFITSKSIMTALTMDIIQHMGLSDENSNSSSSTTTTITMSEADAVNGDESVADLDETNNETKCRRQMRTQRSESFPCDSASMMSCFSDEEEMKGDGNESDSELREEEIFYDSTNENDDLEGKSQEDCGLTKLYLNDIEIDSKEEEQTHLNAYGKGSRKDTLAHGEQNKSMRVAFGVILRLIFPLANGVIQGVKGIRMHVPKSVKRHCYKPPRH
ncbi:hypothetical protein DOY81_015048, partial [Sarcophaga bullata]